MDGGAGEGMGGCWGAGKARRGCRGYTRVGFCRMEVTGMMGMRWQGSHTHEQWKHALRRA